MTKKKKNLGLYIGIGVGSIVLIIVIIGFATNWFQSDNKRDVSQPQSDIVNNANNVKDDSGYDEVDQADQTDQVNKDEVDENTQNRNKITDLSGKKMSKYATDMLTYHNNIRQQCNNTPKLKWNSELAKKSKEYAKKLININSGNMSHYKHGPTNNKDSYDVLNAGENIARFQRIYKPASSGPPQTTLIPIAAKDAVNGWAGEGFGNDAAGKTNPKYRKNGKPMTGHYSAMNWKTSKELGCGYALGKNNIILNVCHYANEPANLVKSGKTKKDYLNCTKPLQIK
jgi:uncharacterized protein YkwD